MKRMLLLLPSFMLLLSLPGVLAQCVPHSSYDFCNENKGDYNGNGCEAWAQVQLTYFTSPDIKTYAFGALYQDEVYVNVLLGHGDTLYAYRGKSGWDWFDTACDSNGCYGGEEIDSGKYVIGTAPMDSPQTVVFVAWDRTDCPDESWTWRASAYGWTFDTHFVGMRIVECNENQDCIYNEFCNLALPLPECRLKSCDDLNPCTTDEWIDYTCVHTPIPGCGEPPDLCEGVVCNPTTITCPDGINVSCTNICNTQTGFCSTCTPDCSGHSFEILLLIVIILLFIGAFILVAYKILR